MNEMLLGMLVGLGWQPFMKNMQMSQELSGGGQPHGGGGIPPEAMQMLQMLMQGAQPSAPLPPQAPHAPLPPRFGPSAQPGAPPIPGGRPALALPPMTSSSPQRPVMPAAM
jgi:hypothetical protein